MSLIRNPVQNLKPEYIIHWFKEKWISSNFAVIVSDSSSNLSAHPKKDEVIAISTKEGLYLSKDNGDKFELVTDTYMVPAVFMLDGGIIFSALDDKGTHLFCQPMDDNSATEISIPDISANNPIIFVTANRDPEQMAIIAYANDIFITKDQGKNWKIIAEEGKIE